MTKNSPDKLLYGLRIEGDLLEGFADSQKIWRVPINALLLIAEYTTNEGPWIDDYFLNFWSWENGQLMKSAIAFYALGRDATFQVLEKTLHAELKFDLLGSTEWASRVIWPPQLAGHSYFTFREIPPVTWREKLAYRCFGPIHEYSLTEEVRELLQRHEIPPVHS